MAEPARLMESYRGYSIRSVGHGEQEFQVQGNEIDRFPSVVASKEHIDQLCSDLEYGIRNIDTTNRPAIYRSFLEFERRHSRSYRPTVDRNIEIIGNTGRDYPAYMRGWIDTLKLNLSDEEVVGLISDTGEFYQTWEKFHRECGE